MALAEQANQVEVELKLGPVASEILASLAGFGRNLHSHNGCVRLQVDDEERLPELAGWLVGQGVKVYRLGATRKTLESVFLEVMGEDERPG